MPKNESNAAAKGAITPLALKKFLANLAETSNVSASAKAARLSSSWVYAHRRKSPPFRKRWHEALAEGYTRLEAELLAEALRAVGGTVSDTTLKSRAQKHRLGLALLAAHRASVRGEVVAAVPSEGSKTKAAAQARLKTRLDLIRERLTATEPE
jgi:hypothetical protein